jgi:hypothetical protein
MNTIPYNAINVLGALALGDGSGGLFYYDALDTTSTDNGMTVIVASDGRRWKLSTGNVGPVLTATEGVTFANGYTSASSGNLNVPLVNAGNVRYWSANYTLNIPAGATIPVGDVRHDHVAVGGHSITYALNSRIWGTVGLAQNSSPATTNAQVGQCYGGEFDVNNNTGYDVTNLAGDGDIGAVVAASGGANTSKFAYMITKLGAAKGFFAGIYLREHCIDPTGFAAYFGNIEPAHGLYFADDYLGGTALSIKTATPVEFRTSAGPAARILSFNDKLQFNCGNGGYAYANGDNTATLASLSNAGYLKAKTTGHNQQTKINNAITIDASLGGQVVLNDAAATTVTTITNGAAGQKLTLIFYTGNTTIANGGATNLHLAGGANFVGTLFDTLSLEFDGGSWFQTGSSLN